MKKKFLKIVALLVVLCIIFSIPVYAEASSIDVADEIESRISSVTQKVTMSMEEIVQTEAPAQEQYSNLLSKIRDTATQSTYALSSGHNSSLSDYYGGAYLNDDKKLTICTTSEDPAIVAAFIEAAGSSDVVLQKVSNTLKEINETANSFDKVLSEYRQRTDLTEEQTALVNDVVEYRSDIFINKFVVGILDINDDKERVFWSLFNTLPSNVVELEVGYKGTETVTVRPGGGLYLSASESMSATLANQSVGYRGYRINSYGNRVYGFVGCGHGAKSALYRGGEKVGDLYESRNGGMYDLAFYDITSSTTLSNLTAYSDDTGGENDVVSLSTLAPPSIEDVLVGSTVMKVGSRTFYTQGQIIAIFDTMTTSSSSYRSLISTTALALPGDSGGAAFIYYNGSYRIIGTVTGSRFISDIEMSANTFTKSFLAAYEYSVNALGFTIYRY